MEKRMEEVTVSVSDSDHVCIKVDDYGAGEQVITFHPDQVDLLIQWLKEAKAKALSNAKA